MPSLSSYPIDKIREQFPILNQKVNGHPYIYLDTAATAQKPKCVIQAISDFYSNSYATINRAVYTLSKEATHACSSAREQVLKFLGASSDYQAVFTSGTTESINLIAHSFVPTFLNSGDEVIVFASEHHSNLVPWQMAQEKCGITLRVLPVLPSGDVDLDAFEKEISDKTRLVSFAHVSNVTGAIHPVREICTVCRKQGIYTLIDGAQSAGHIPVEIDTIGCDFFAFSGHKLYGPTGIGVLVGLGELLEQMPPLFGGGDMIDSVSFESSSYATSPQKFESGTPKIAEIIGLKAALDFVNAIGVSAIEAYEQKLIKMLTSELQGVKGIQLVGNPKKRSSIVSFVIEGMHSLDLATLLDLKGIAIRSGNLCAQPYLESRETPFVARISIGAYSTLEDISATIKALKSYCN